jgi:hypothetical protein
MPAAEAWHLGGRGLLAAAHGGEKEKARARAWQARSVQRFRGSNAGHVCPGRAAARAQPSVDEVVEYLGLPDTDVNMRSEARTRARAWRHGAAARRQRLEARS